MMGRMIDFRSPRSKAKRMKFLGSTAGKSSRFGKRYSHGKTKIKKGR